MKNMVMRPFDTRWWTHLFFASVIALGYTVILRSSLPNSEYLDKISIAAFVFSLLSQASYVDAGEIGTLLGILGNDTGIRCLPGLYFNPAILVTARIIKILLGYAVAVPTEHHEGNTRTVKIKYDQEKTSYKVTHATNSLLKLKADQAVSSFFSWAGDITDAGGKTKYYKVGVIGYYGCVIIAFVTTPEALRNLITTLLKMLGEFLVQALSIALSFLVQMVTNILILSWKEVSSLFS